MKNFTGVTPAITAGPSASASIDTTGAAADIPCSLTLTVTDTANRTSTSLSTVTARVPPMSSANDGGPYLTNVGTNVTNVGVTGAASVCTVETCT